MREKRQYLFDSPGKIFLANLLDKTGGIFCRNRPRGEITPGLISKILLIRLDHIGDLLMTTPAIRALRKTFPAADIHLLIKTQTREAVELNPHLNKIITLDAPWTIVRGKKARPAEIAQCVWDLRREVYDCVVGFRPDPREALLIAATGARCRIGYGSRGGEFCFTHPVSLDPGQHEILRAIDLLAPLGVNPDGCNMELSLSPGDRKRAKALISRAGGSPGDRIIGLHPGAASPFKRWRAEGFSRLGNLLAGPGRLIILLGSEHDRPLLQEIAQGMEEKPPIIVPAGIRLLAALVEQLDCLVGNDSAAAHIAQAVGTRAVVLFGPTHQEITGPLDRQHHTVIRHPLPCSPCWLPGRKFICEHDLQCWKKLRPEEVAAAVTADRDPLL